MQRLADGGSTSEKYLGVAPQSTPNNRALRTQSLSNLMMFQ